MPVTTELRTARVVGEQQRVDERQTPHPMADAGDYGERMRIWRDMTPSDPLIRAVERLGALFRQAPPGKVNPIRARLHEPKRMSEHIKEIAHFGGADVAGITYLDQSYVYSHRASGSKTYGVPAGDPIDLPYKYAIVVGVAGDFDKYMAANSRIADVEYAMDYQRLHFACYLLAGYIQELGYEARPAHAMGLREVNPVALGVLAGLGELGRHGLLIHEKYGSRLHLAVIATNLPMEIDQPVDIGVNEFCQYCKKCARTCPTRSITFGGKDVYNGVEKWRINVDTCYKARLSGHDITEKCLYCVTSCCYNKRDAWYHTLSIWFLKKTPVPLRPLIVKPLTWLDDVIWKQRPHVDMKWLDYDSEAQGARCGMTGCTATHPPAWKKRLQRPGREAAQVYFPGPGPRVNGQHTNGHPWAGASSSVTAIRPAPERRASERDAGTLPPA